MSLRKSCVAGRFYPGDKKGCEKLIEEILKKEKNRINTLPDNLCLAGGIAPHAGYVYSGYEAVHLFLQASQNKKKYDTVVIITPNHTGYGEEISVYANDKWESPYGEIDVDKEMRNELIEKFKIPGSVAAQLYEHSGEVMLPMLKHFLNYPFKLVSINMLQQTYENSFKIAKAVFEVSEKQGKEILFIASSDLSHYIDARSAEEADMKIINLVLNGNIKEIEERVREDNITVCGYGPIMAFCEYIKLKKGTIKLLRYGNSGEVSHDNRNVVGYSAIAGYE